MAKTGRGWRPPPGRQATIVAILCVGLIGCVAESGDDARGTYSSALKHFALRDDTMSLSEDGLILVGSLMQSDSDVDVRLDAFHACGDLRPFAAYLDARRPNVESVAALIDAHPRWRLATPQEQDSPPHLLDFKRIKTRILPSTPRFTADGERALVHFRFIWSEHGATSVYVLDRREGGVWEVACSDLDFRL